MTIVASIGARDVVCRFTHRASTVVARATRTKYGVVIDSSDVLETCHGMTVFTAVGGIDVRGVFACGIDPVVARRAISAD